MKLKEVIDCAMTFLGDGSSAVNPFIAENAKITLLVKCANMIIKEIATEYLPLVANEKISLTNGSFRYDMLSKRVYEILKIVDANSGENIKFEQKLSTCIAKNGNFVEVCYVYTPEDIAIDGECEVSTKISVKTLALGVCSEYCMIEGMYEQSVMLEKRFKDDMRNACRKNGEKNVRARRWN